MLFADDDLIKNPLIENITNVLGNQKLSSYSIYCEIKKNNVKCNYNEINTLCNDLIRKKNGSILCKEGYNPSVFYKNDGLVSSNYKKRNNKEINKEINNVFDNNNSSKRNITKMFDNENEKTKKYRKTDSIFSEKIISSNKSLNMNEERKNALEQILQNQYEKFIDTEDVKYLDNISKVNKIKNNL